MDAYLLDTNILEYWYNPNRSEHKHVKKHIESLGEGTPLWISILTLGEIEYGHRLSPNPDPKAQEQYLEFINERIPYVVEIDRHTVGFYGEMRARLFEKFAPKEKRKKGLRPEELVDPITAKELGIQENDLWITAQAIQYDMVLVTNDKMNQICKVMPDLRVENWAVAPTAP